MNQRSVDHLVAPTDANYDDMYRRAIVNCRPCCNLLISWPLAGWRL